MIRKLGIREGWVTVLLTSLLVLIAVLSIQRAEWADGLGILTWVMAVGLVAGLVSSKVRSLPQAVLHLGGLVIGILSVVWAMTAYLPDEIGGTRDKLRWLWERWEQWGSTIVNGESAEDLYLFVLFISVLTFVMAYLTIWFVIHARWIWAAVFFPGAILLLNLGYSLKVPTSLVVFFIFIALLLLMRFTLLQRELTWKRVRIDYPGSLVWRGLWVAGYLAVAVIIFGWALPVSAKSGTINRAWHSVDGPWRSVEGQFNEWFVGIRGPGGSSIGGFAAFEDSFEVGGPLSLSDDPVMVLEGPGRGEYIEAHAYDIYTGRGWRSSISSLPESETDDDDQQSRIVPHYELQPGEAVPLDPRFSEERERETYSVTLLDPRGSIILSPGLFSSTELGADLVVSWQEINETVDVQSATEADVPQELWPLVEMLKTIDLTPAMPQEEPAANPNATAEPEPTPVPTPDLTKLPASVFQMIQQLQTRGISASYQIDPGTYHVSTMSYSGRFPMLGDIEAVYARDGVSEDQTYSIDVMQSEATGDQLRAAGTDYPTFITDHYLELPVSVTDRTRELAQEITQEDDTAYDKAKAIESYLRENITYSENVAFPPEGADVVDFVLFDTQEGYCEYYASAFIVMARSLGLPARMMTGFFPSDEESQGGILYRELNAHAWPQVYFPGYGWIGFEPTAAREAVDRDPAASTANSSGPAAGPDLGAQSERIFGEFTDPLLEANTDLAGSNGLLNASSSDDTSLGELAIRVLPLTILLIVLVTAYFWLRGMRGLTPANQLYSKLSRGAHWSGVKTHPSMTPNEYATHVSETVPGSRQPVRELTELYVREAFSQHETTQSDVLHARQAWHRLRGKLLKHGFKRLLFWRRRGEDEEGDEW